ncbi:MAG: DUF2089 domain-containing protein [Caldilineaceae bacterium]|nr:DUF2089 domain-containing protein [Caldilineaceae bacterium]
MNALPKQCPFTGGEIIVTRFYCPDVDVSVEGRFSPQVPFAQLSPEQLHFVETFIRAEGKLSRMENELKLSYPTIRGRLHEVIRALGFEPGKDEPTVLTEEERRRILQDLDDEKISFEEAMRRLQGDDA